MNYTEMGAYPDQRYRARKQARQARHLILTQKEAGRQRIIEGADIAFEALIGAFILYVLMFLACL